MSTGIELRENNLYRNGRVIEFPEQGESILQRKLIKYTAQESDQYYTVKKEDRLDIIAYKAYKDIVEDSSKYWWVIADVNNIMNPLDIDDLVGKEILIPDILNVLLAL